jgi:hypothetical protein
MFTYKTEEEVIAVVHGFESCETDKAAFKHQDHLTVAVCYLQESSIEEATNRMREGLWRFIAHHNIDRNKYNETITLFWFELVAEALKKMPSAASLVERCNAVIESFNDAGLASEYYSTERLFSARAREVFVEPDLKHWKEQ